MFEGISREEDREEERYRTGPVSSGWCYLKEKYLASWVALSQHEVMDLGESGAEAFLR